MTSSAGILIIGGGPVGATLALSLQARGISSTLLEARPRGASHRDQRALALSYGTRLILQRLGLWQDLAPQATAINTIHISQRGSFGRTLLKAEDQGREALGYVLSYGALTSVLDRALAAEPGIRILHEAEVTDVLPGTTTTRVTFNHGSQETQLETELAVLADGGRSLGDIPGLQRETKEYGHDALVTKVHAEFSHDNIAYERFTPAGPMALLPNGKHDFSLVWTGLHEEVTGILKLDDADFLNALHAHFGDRVGRFLSVGKRMSFSLKLSRLNPVVLSHFVVVGNAAQTMHPVAGQGFNVGLRDAWELSEHLANTESSSWGEAEALSCYAKTRQRDTKRGLMFTDFLVNIFSNDIVGISELRSVGLGFLDVAKPVKRFLINKMSFGARG
ncbi:MAG: 2-octaprenyl-6-methoxyphenyl hydroxylase [Betaproteobacteria bacterium HGW-Betaproteobacteria-8]|nr:MAG: 2-octaprenyl-6-methoxyphenyl hydroxylase [Betaproteobacteria bacterium HGW-Betaproteobacteria-8]